jgi:hypothetical protein
MSHFAQVKNGIVQQVIVAEQDFVNALPDAGDWLQTSIRTSRNEHPEGRPLRGNFASIGYTYDSTNDVFIPPQPFPSWQLNTTTWSWEPPVPYPEGTIKHWNENEQQWI